MPRCRSRGRRMRATSPACALLGCAHDNKACPDRHWSPPPSPPPLLGFSGALSWSRDKEARDCEPSHVLHEAGDENDRHRVSAGVFGGPSCGTGRVRAANGWPSPRLRATDIPRAPLRVRRRKEARPRYRDPAAGTFARQARLRRDWKGCRSPMCVAWAGGEVPRR